MKPWLLTFFDNLRAASLQKPVEFAALIIAVISVALLIWQLWALNDTLESQAYNYIIAGLAELDKADIEHSDLRKYFLKNEPYPNGEA